MTNFAEFLGKVRKGTIDLDVAWRGYDIPAAVKPRHVREALKYMGLSWEGEHAIGGLAARWGIPTHELARVLVGQWWVWRMVCLGRRVRGLAKRASPTRELPP